LGFNVIFVDSEKTQKDT